MSGGIRSFVAVPLETAELVDRVTAAQESVGRIRGVKWVAPHHFHFTLKFLGEVPRERVEEARAALADSAAGIAPFRLTLSGLGCFPAQGAARVVWAGCSEGRADLENLAIWVETAFVKKGFPPESRPFSAHMTLGRVKDPRAGREVVRALREGHAFEVGAMTAREIALFRSDLGSSGPAYTALARAKLSS